VAGVFKFCHKGLGLAGLEVHKTRRSTSNEGFEIQEWGGGGVLGRKSIINKRGSISETLEGGGEKGSR